MLWINRAVAVQRMRVQAIQRDHPGSLKYDPDALIKAAKKGCFIEQTLGQVNRVNHRIRTPDGFVEIS